MVLRVSSTPFKISLTGLSPSMVRLSRLFSYLSRSLLRPYNPDEHKRIGLGCSRFARRYSGNHYCFLFLRVLRCFSSPGSPPVGYWHFMPVGCPIRIPADQPVCARPRSFSQLVASFIASESLGILHAPFSAFLPALSLKPARFFSSQSCLLSRQA